MELFESVHFALFFVMVLFVAKVLGLVSDGILTEAEWLELDRSCRDEAAAQLYRLDGLSTLRQGAPPA